MVLHLRLFQTIIPADNVSMTAKQMLQLQQEDIIKAAQSNVFTNSLLNQQKSDSTPDYTINLSGTTLNTQPPTLRIQGWV